jgi:aerobic-type carbon monoxide dehydrogenase small subunit (CoxS/CutS family)
MVVAAQALLNTTPQPRVDEVREGLAGNLCRCAGYERIVAAVLRAAEPDEPAELPA